MPSADPVIIACPQCARSLPGQAVQCQFCGASLAGVPRPTAVPKARRGPKEEWINTVYVVVSGWWIFNGLRTILASLFLLPKELAAMGQIATTFQVIGIALGSFTAAVGLGLLFKANLARTVANFLCWLQIVGGLLGLLGTLKAMMFIGLVGVLYLAVHIVDIAMAGLQIWIIGETDDYFLNG